LGILRLDWLENLGILEALIYGGYKLIHQSGRLDHFANPKAANNTAYPNALREILDIKDAEIAYEEISKWPGYKVTPLHSLDGIASELRIDKIWYKDEAGRFDLGSFKALGGAYAVFMQLKEIIESKTGNAVTITDLLDKSYGSIVSDITFTCATDGNHGRSVAWGAQLFGCHCVIYIHAQVSEGRQLAIEKLGAQVINVDGNYDDSVRQAAVDAGNSDRIIVSDTSYEGYLTIPKFVALGYTVMLKEIIHQLEGNIPTHVFLQGGVGGLAAAVCAYFWQYWGDERPRLIIVEPEAANCLQQSARLGSPVAVKGDLETLMAGLACGEVSLLAWEILSTGCDDFVTLDEGSVAPCMRLLAKGSGGDPDIVAGESAVAGLAALIGALQTTDLATNLDLNSASRVLVIGTEGATDQALYDKLVNPVPF
jgi:diaminopropionate ammonia-lyase